MDYVSLGRKNSGESLETTRGEAGRPVTRAAPLPQAFPVRDLYVSCLPTKPAAMRRI